MADAPVTIAGPAGHHSTAGLAARQRLSMWREVFGQAIVRLDIEPEADAPFDAEGTLCALPGAAYASVTTSPARFTRSRRMIAADADPDEKLFLITADAPLEVTQRGREHMLASGDAIFLRGGEVNRIRCRRRGRLTNIGIALADLSDHHAGVDDLAMRVVPRHSALLGLLYGYVDTLRQHPEAAGAARQLIGGHIGDLIGAVATAEPLPERPGIRAARLQAIKTEIARALSDPRLGIEAVARRCGIGPRYARRLFQEEGESFSAYLLARRLDLAHRQLLHPGGGRGGIAAIAYGCGFGDLSYFNRCFRRRFGMTPSELRAGS